MTLKTPDWLISRDGEVRIAPNGKTLHVLINGRLEYKLTPLPADGKHFCFVEQSINMKRIDKGEIYPSNDAALQGGLECLRQALGW